MLLLFEDLYIYHVFFPSAATAVAWCVQSKSDLSSWSSRTERIQRGISAVERAESVSYGVSLMLSSTIHTNLPKIIVMNDEYTSAYIDPRRLVIRGM